jgi:hypothetical protein
MGAFIELGRLRLGGGKLSLQVDCENVLIAILTGSEDQMEKPDEANRAQLFTTHFGIF